MTPEQKTARLKRLVSAAISLVTGQQGIHVLRCLYDLGDDWVERYPIYTEFRSALPAEVPISTERLLWHFDKVLELDPLLAKVEYNFRAKLMSESFLIIEKYS
ncbi:TPA: hypothetical protein GRI96_24845 [Vibrio parahaemolyticus]|uniref:hypothetical protein n=1 Tax=Vibrio parahaemolyticus TaxID=670 RepID=UPI00064A31D6|nr:hypothetical protein [Vibrio parahaemolyticus]EGR1985732.1 hypothetical protein [Vibrio parahaemolyticus]EII3443190.1 hypothetical protein [Vibrio parahaemolyticus]ELA7843091.1 hypothetical protein [Vibrio parahaemolyticus]OXD26687.1 hypothetical protein CA164_23410 [Vibrio parahaemolyticus]HAS6809131.1 hypothetical protein [Vibrio parahaemolyticus]